MRFTTVTAAAAILSLGISTAFAGNGRPYSFRLVASGDNANGMTFLPPALNDAGSVAFDATKYLVGSAILTGPDFTADAFVSTADPAGPFRSGNQPYINNAGSIAFNGTVRATGEGGIFVGHDTAHNLAAGIGAIAVAPADINEPGQVAIKADFGLYTHNPLRNHDGIYVGRAGVTGATFVAENTRLSEPGRFRRIDSAPAINDAGTVAFVAQTWDQTATGYVTGIYSGNTTDTALIDSTGSFLTFGGGWVDINNAGTLLFTATPDGSLVTGLYRGSAAGTELVAQENNDFLDINARDVNNNGDVVFNAQLGGGGFNGIFTGPSRERDRVVGPGDTLFGKTVRDAFFRTGGFNDNGEVAFSFITTDSERGVAVATPAMMGDANVDQRVDLTDFNVLAANFGSTNADWWHADFNGDERVNLDDFNILAAHFGQSAGASGPTSDDWSRLSAAVPEPAAAGATLLACTALPRVRRRRRPSVA